MSTPLIPPFLTSNFRTSGLQGFEILQILSGPHELFTSWGPGRGFFQLTYLRFFRDGVFLRYKVIRGVRKVSIHQGSVENSFATGPGYPIKTFILFTSGFITSLNGFRLKDSGYYRGVPSFDLYSYLRSVILGLTTSRTSRGSRRLSFDPGICLGEGLLSWTFSPGDLPSDYSLIVIDLSRPGDTKNGVLRQMWGL